MTSFRLSSDIFDFTIIIRLNFLLYNAIYINVNFYLSATLFKDDLACNRKVYISWELSTILFKKLKNLSSCLRSNSLNKFLSIENYTVQKDSNNQFYNQDENIGHLSTRENYNSLE